MKRLSSALLIGFLLSTIPLQAYATASTISNSPTSPSPSPIFTLTSTLSDKSFRKVVSENYKSSLLQARHGRDLAFADAKASLQQSLQLAKTKVARNLAKVDYQNSISQVQVAYQQALMVARQTYEATLVTLKGK